MSSPFLAQYAKTYNRPELFDEVAHQLLLVERRTRDPKTGRSITDGMKRRNRYGPTRKAGGPRILEPGLGLVCDGACGQS